MWKRKELKQEAKRNLKKNYWAMVAVCFIMAVLSIEYATTMQMVQEYNTDKGYIGKAENMLQTQDDSDTAAAVLERAGIALNQELHPERGVFAALFNTASKTRTTFMNVLRMLEEIMYDSGIKAVLIGFLSILIAALYEIFIKSLLIVGERRFFLENNLYHKTCINRVFSAFRKDGFKNTAWILLVRNVFLTLWCLTVAGGIIKVYSYRMIPYILAENPNIGRKEAFELSRQMMNGNKWKTFLLDLSFLPWKLLTSFTVGLLGVFLVNPYTRGTEAALYLKLREAAAASSMKGAELLNDFALTELPEGNEGKYYPGFEKPEKQAGVDYRCHYSILNLILFFFTASFIGWCWEVSLHLIKDGIFVNRGTMLGPWLPIYGVGGMVALILLKRFMDKPILTFGLTMFLCGLVEYFSSWYLEFEKGAKWWDYSGYLLNLNGRICLEGLLTFAIAGCAFMYLIAPRLNALYNKIPDRIKVVLCAGLFACFGADLAYSHFNPNTGKGITDYAGINSKSSLQ